MNRSPIRSLALLALMSAGAEGGHSQEMKQKASTVILREQASAIAEEILDSLSLSSTSTGRVSLSVRGADFPDILENAMLESLQRRGLSGILTEEVSGGNYTLHLLVHEQRADLEASMGSTAGRSVKTTLEARVREGDGTARYLGRFFRIVSDTTMAGQQAVPVSNLLGGSGSFLDKIIEPLVVVAGAFLIVYLFFTVRS